MALAAGTRLGPYEIIGQLGAGGMGEVYRARDTRLGREVAIKVLPHDRVADDSRKRRFIQEARAASALNHPNIVTIHEVESFDGLDVIVMELISGRTLHDVIRPRMKLADILRLAIPMADALAQAHAAGIVHRDLKPANVMVSAEGAVKILDFGLAKLVDLDAGSSADRETLTTIGDAPLSVAGHIVGTPAYMSPEQATGAAVDSRSDIFSFGAVLYEMVTARRAFSGNSATETLAAVIHVDPKPPSELAPGVPKELDRLILRCLRKAPSRRPQHMSDVKVELVELHEESPTRSAINVRPDRRLRTALIGGTVALMLLIATVIVIKWSRMSTVPPPRLVPVTASAGSEAMPSLSPDGSQVAFSWDGEGAQTDRVTERKIWVKIIGRGPDVRQLTQGPDDDWWPSWSPDGTQIAFLRTGRNRSAGTVYVVSPLGGEPRKLSTASIAYSQLAWSLDSRWVIAATARPPGDANPGAGSLLLFPLDGGDSRQLTTPSPPNRHLYPALSPDGHHLAYESCSGNLLPPCDLYVVDLNAEYVLGGSPRQLTRRKMPIHGIAWTPNGRSLIYGVSPSWWFGIGIGSELWRVDVDGTHPAERIESSRVGSFAPATAPSRPRLVFTQSRDDVDIFRFESPDRATPVVASSFVDYAPSFSPDGRRIAFESSRSGESQEIWTSDPDGTHLFQVTGGSVDWRGPFRWRGNPSWSRDGLRLVFNMNPGDDVPDLWIVGADGGTPHRLTNDPFIDALPVWSHDNWIYYRQDRPDGSNIVRIRADGGAPERVTEHGALYPMISSDGKTLFYTKPPEGTSPLFSHAIDTGTEHRLADCVMSRALAVSGGSLYYIGCAPGQARVPLYRLDLARGKTDTIGTLDQGLGIFMGLAVSPDGKTILFARAGGAGSDLMMIEDFR